MRCSSDDRVLVLQAVGSTRWPHEPARARCDGEIPLVRIQGHDGACKGMDLKHESTQGSSDPSSVSDLPESRRNERRNERRRPGKKGRRRSKTIATKRLSKEELALAEELKSVVVDRPDDRSQCATGIRPCPYVSCKHHLYLDVNPDTGSIKLNFPDLEVWEMVDTCALDVADRGGITLEEVGEILNLTRERIRQVEVKGLQKLREAASELGLQDFLNFLESHILLD